MAGGRGNSTPSTILKPYPPCFIADVNYINCPDLIAPLVMGCQAPGYRPRPGPDLKEPNRALSRIESEQMVDLHRLALLPQSSVVGITSWRRLLSCTIRSAINPMPARAKASPRMMMVLVPGRRSLVIKS